MSFFVVAEAIAAIIEEWGYPFHHTKLVEGPLPEAQLMTYFPCSLDHL